MRCWYVKAALIVAGALGCTTPNPEFCDAQRPCTDPRASFCDIAGDYGEANTCVEPPAADAAPPQIDATPGSPTLTVTLEGTGAGRVVSTPAGIDCPDTCSAAFEAGTAVTLSATPSATDAFVTWGGDCARGFGTCGLTIASDLAVSAEFGEPRAHLWSFSRGATGAEDVRAVAFDDDGDVYVGGSFTGEVDFGDGVPVEAVAGADGFVAKYSETGSLMWVTVVDGPAAEVVESLAVGANHVFAGGALDGRALDEQDALLGGPFTAALNRDNGSVAWRRNIQSPKKGFGSMGSATGVAVGGGEIAFVGWFAGTLEFGAGTLRSDLIDIFVLRMNVAGDTLAATRYTSVLPDLRTDQGWDAVIDASGNLLIAATTTSGDMNLGGGLLSHIGETDVVIAKFNPAGAHVWSQILGGDEVDEIAGIDVDVEGNVYIAGTFRGTASFGGAAIAAPGGNFLSSGYVASFEPDGSPRWSLALGAQLANVTATDLAVSPRGEIAVSGLFDRLTDFGGGTLSPSGSSDIFLVRLRTADGAHRDSRRFGASNDAEDQPDEIRAVAFDRVGRLAVAGRAFGTFSFGGAALSNAGTSDAFVSLFGP